MRVADEEGSPERGHELQRGEGEPRASARHGHVRAPVRPPDRRRQQRRQLGRRRQPRPEGNGRIRERRAEVGDGEHAPGHPRLHARGIAARLRGAGSDQLPAGDRPGLHVRSATGRADLLARRQGNARTRRQPGAGTGRRRRARAALGPHRRDLWRRPARVRRHGQGRRAGLLGQHAAAGTGQGLRHAEAHDGPRPAGVRHQYRSRERGRTRAARRLLPAVREDHQGNEDRGRDAVV